MNKPIIFASLCLLIIPVVVFADCSGEAEATEAGQGHKPQALKLKVAAIAFVLFAGAMGVGIPILGKAIPCLNPGSSLFSIIKVFAAGVILATGFIHVLPDAFESLTSPCLKENPWRMFPFTGFVATVAAIGTLISNRVLELGTVVHSIIIGISLGVSGSPDTIRPLVAALAFYQFFEGIGLGGCIAQANFKSRATAVMALFFSLTTPIGVAIGIGISNIYTENSPTALVVEGVLNAASAGILIYMSLVDMLVAELMNSKLQSNIRLLAGANLSVLLGAGCISLLAIWS
ncbi:hypothetical protein PRUPE_3G084500 [Prunus persica]|uniref:Uncharacterized protein n=1 Tax=Prunus persica TaxID=3760 RepID=M5WWM8_PRUPE|nr:hypothetical protein PRUPE_3G084500 [Prunus persica]